MHLPTYSAAHNDTWGTGLEDMKSSINVKDEYKSREHVIKV